MQQNMEIAGEEKEKLEKIKHTTSNTDFIWFGVSCSYLHGRIEQFFNNEKNYRKFTGGGNKEPLSLFGCKNNPNRKKIKFLKTLLKPGSTLE